MSILVQNVSKSYGLHKAVNHISFAVQAGEVVGFLGPNGAGKTTTMRILTGYLPPDSGEISMQHNGRHFRMSQHAYDLKRLIGYLPENNPLYTDMVVTDYLAFCARIQDVPARQTGPRIRAVLDQCGLGEVSRRQIGTLSKGYKQRVGLAQALIHDPQILVLDEPTEGLDPNQIIEIRQLIQAIGRQKTVLLSSHILPEVEATCSRMLILHKGEIVADGTPAQLRHARQGAEQLHIRLAAQHAEALDTAEATAAIARLPTVGRVVCQAPDRWLLESQAGQSSRKAVFELCVQKQWYLLDMYGTETSLEEVFRALTHH